MRKYGIRFALVLALSSGLVMSAAAQTAPSTQQSNSRVDDIISKMSTEEKIDYIGGTGFAVRPMPKLGLPALEMSDGPAGVRSNAKFPSTTYASGIGLAATFNPDLAQRVGDGIGKDARARGIHFMLGPGVNIYKAPMNGRNFEYFGEDPFLASQIAVGYITGMQKNGVSATIKHFLGNNSEFDRHNVDVYIDERAMREIYLPAFEAAVKKAKVGSIMDSYNLLNGEHLTQSGHANVDIARKEWGFDGVMMSDWVATYDGIAAANNGLDLEMPTGAFMNQKNLMPAIQDGRVKMATIDEKIRRILNTANRFGWLDRQQADYSLSKYNEQNHRVALDGAREGIVLLKNTGNVLPLDRKSVKTVLVVGPNAYPAVPVAGGSGKSIPFTAVSVLEGISNLVGSNINVLYDRGIPSFTELVSQTVFMTEPQNGKRGVKVEQFDSVDVSGSPKTSKVVSKINSNGVTWDDFQDNWEELSASFQSNKPVSRRWTGYYTAEVAGPHEVVAQYGGENSGYRVIVDDKKVLDQWEEARAQEDHKLVDLTAGVHKVVVEEYQKFPIGGKIKVGIISQAKLVSAAAKAMAAKADAVVLAVGFDPDSETEGADRTFVLPFGQDELIRQVAAANKKTIVALTSGGSVDTRAWLDQVPAFMELWYPGERGGTAVAEVLFGDVNPSGRLPITFEKKLEDNPSIGSYYTAPGTRKIEYKDGVFVGYRGYEKNNVQPLFPFGYGLSYTTFKYGNLKVTSASSPAGAGPQYTVSFDVTNTGNRAGADVAQVYVGETKTKVPRPAKELKGFSKVVLKPGETRHVSVSLDGRSFAYYDAEAKGWKINPGAFEIMVGRSSADIQLRQSVTIAEAAATSAKL